MRSPSVVHSSAGTPSVSVWTGSILNTSAALVPSKPDDIITLTTPAQALLTSSNNTAGCWRLSSRGRRRELLYAGSPVRLMPAPAFDAQPQQATGGSAHPVAPIALQPEPPPRPRRAEKIELAIDSLQNYEVIKPIPVLIESLGDKVFVAEAPDLNLSTSGNSIGAAFLMLKEQIVATYEGHRTKRGQDSERARQLAVMDKHIGKTKRHWF